MQYDIVCRCHVRSCAPSERCYSIYCPIITSTTAALSVKGLATMLSGIRLALLVGAAIVTRRQVEVGRREEEKETVDGNRMAELEGVYV